MLKTTILISSLFSFTVFADQPCATGADFCVKLVNESSTSATVKSISPVGFKMPGVDGLVILPHSTTPYIPVFGGPQNFLWMHDAPWSLMMTPTAALKTSCIMSYTNPVVFQPANCGVALSQPNPYDLIVKFNFFSLPQ